MEWIKEGIAVVEGRKREINNFQPSRSKRVSNQREEEKLNMRVVRERVREICKERKKVLSVPVTKKTFSLLLLEMMTYSFPPFAPIPGYHVDIQCAFFPRMPPPFLAYQGIYMHAEAFGTWTKNCRSGKTQALQFFCNILEAKVSSLSHFTCIADL